ncbi:hypothetical protein BDZ90DRAFT_232652 [Jaminaea rosea]|uniref:UDP-N-acetylglucosamine transferase subunit ALG13 n=1 Tax=Jaminaea rosea TaxID=1569628 RepID=A0A316UT70_9BASI|nr:hypothetical protein BDZ90DRAFT_232652 [Jaminaea rosea]PWN27093.1 hypothetical protein BDZ90DRAFT_232652 [Jaminaea rosea]
MTLPSRPPRIFVTVGSTQFVDLISYLLTQPFLNSLPAKTSLTIQYGKSDLAAILTREDNALTSSASSTAQDDASSSVASSSAIRLDAGSERVPEPGLRASKQHGLSWKGSQLTGMDPGKTGAIDGWQLVGADEGQSSEESSRESEADDEETAAEDSLAAPPSPRRPAGASFTSLPSSLKFRTSAPQSISIELIDFLPDLCSHLSSADIVISHAGSGTILETLRLPIPPRLIVVPNTTLMDNHQVELADAIAKGGWATCARVELPGVGGAGKNESSLQRVVREALTQAEEPTPFPPAKPERFRGLVDGAMGFA